MKIGIFGCGNMGSALAKGFHKGGVELYLYSPSQTKANELADSLDGHFVKELNEMPKNLDWYVLAFKPQQLNEFNFEFNDNSKILSVLAGTEIKKLETKFNVNKIARLMPNTPSKIGAGANLLFSSFDASDLINKLNVLGKLFVLNKEEEIDTLTAFSGSGPALIFEFARLFKKHMSIINGETDFSDELIIETFLGSSMLMKEEVNNGCTFEELREQVTSKKGVTYEALQILENNNFDHIIGRAFDSAYKRTIELKKGI